MGIDVKDLAMFTIIKNLKQVVNHKFYKLDEDFDLEEFLGNIDSNISSDDLKKIEDKLFRDWFDLSDDDLKQLQTKVIDVIDKLTPRNLPRFGCSGKSSKPLNII